MTRIEDFLKENELGNVKQTFVTQEMIAQLFPNLAALHEDTVFIVYREYRPTRDSVEYTVFYQEPGKQRMRLDAELDLFKLEDENVRPEIVKILSLMESSEYMRYYERD